jgi:hypothetical protein
LLVEFTAYAPEGQLNGGEDRECVEGLGKVLKVLDEPAVSFRSRQGVLDHYRLRIFGKG